jgi:hypothetical protein
MHTCARPHARTHARTCPHTNQHAQVFDKSKDWSDYVSALSKLIKVLQRPEFCDAAKVGPLRIIPEKAMVARRLAQSMNPILPNGVHRKALDAYRVILSRIGRDQLAADLALWSQVTKPETQNQKP